MNWHWKAPLPKSGDGPPKVSISPSSMGRIEKARLLISPCDHPRRSLTAFVMGTAREEKGKINSSRVYHASGLAGYFYWRDNGRKNTGYQSIKKIPTADYEF